MRENLILYNYHRDQITTGILHIGVGNFHRAHQAFYTNRLLEYSDQKKWGICGLSLLPDDEKIVKGLRRQQNVYTVTVCGKNGNDRVYNIGSLIDLIWAMEDPRAGIQKFADKDIKIISCTITEGGYNIDRTTGEFMLNNKLVQHDLKYPSTPKTVFGYVAEGLRTRMKNGAGPVTFLTCDNLQHNGDTAKQVFTTFVSAQDTKLAEWMEKNVTFPNSMVDRITPVTTPSDVMRLNNWNGTEDRVPVYCEDFIQWVICQELFLMGRRGSWKEVNMQNGMDTFRTDFS